MNKQSQCLIYLFKRNFLGQFFLKCFHKNNSQWKKWPKSFIQFGHKIEESSRQELRDIFGI